MGLAWCEQWRRLKYGMKSIEQWTAQITQSLVPRTLPIPYSIPTYTPATVPDSTKKKKKDFSVH